MKAFFMAIVLLTLFISGCRRTGSRGDLQPKDEPTPETIELIATQAPKPGLAVFEQLRSDAISRCEAALENPYKHPFPDLEQSLPARALVTLQKSGEEWQFDDSLWMFQAESVADAQFLLCGISMAKTPENVPLGQTFRLGEKWHNNFLVRRKDGRVLGKSEGTSGESLVVWLLTIVRDPTILRHDSNVIGLAFAPVGKMLATATSSGEIHFWNTSNGQRLSSVKALGPTESLQSFSFSPNGKRLAVHPRPGALKLWDLATGTEVTVLPNNPDVSSNIAFSQDGNTVAFGEWNGFVVLADTSTGREIGRLVHDSSERKRLEPVNATAVAFSPNGSVLASGSFDGTIKLWDMTTRKQIVALRHGEPNLESVVFLSRGAVLGSAGIESVRLWDASTGTLIRILKGKYPDGSKIYFSGAEFSPDGSLLIAGPDIWHVNSGRELGKLYGNKLGLRTISPDGRTIAVKLSDRFVKLWEMPAAPY